MNLEETTQLYASVLRQLLPVGGYDASPHTEALSVDVYAHAKLFAQADLDAKRILSVLEGIPSELINEYEAEYGLPLKCTVNASRTFEQRLQILNWVRTSRNVLNRGYLEQLLAIFGVVLIDIVKFKPLLCTAACDSPVNTEQLRYKVFLRLQYPMSADMSCIVENYLPGYLRIEWMVDMPWGDWILNPSVTVNANSIAHYTAYKTNQREYYDSYANLDLTDAIIRSFHNADMQQWQAFIDAVNELTGVNNWTIDASNTCILYNDPNIDPINYYKNHASSTTIYNSAKDACTSNEVITRLSNSYGPGGEFYSYNKTICYYNQMFYGSNRSINIQIYEVVRAVPVDTSIAISFVQIAQKIISNTSSSNQAISLLAEAFLEAVANSIFNAESSKQFVKLSDLLPQFELHKTLRT